MELLSLLTSGFDIGRIHVAQLFPLLLLPLALLPLLLKGYVAFPHPAIQSMPEDLLSIWLARMWRICGALAISSMSVALAQPYLTEQTVEKIGKGANIMIVLDRSGSMNDDFGEKKAGQAINKMAAARRVLQDMVKQSKNDLVGMVSFSTSPILVAPLSSDHAYVEAALEATEAGGMGFTAVARGLGMALDFFEGKPVTGGRALLLVSDGGAHLDGKTQDLLRAMFMRQNASLYWIYLRSANGASLKQAPSEEEGINAYPEYALHEFFKTINVPYHVYEAENADEVKLAIQDIAHLKNKPTRYVDPVSKKDMSWIFYTLAWLSCLVLLVLHNMEVKQWKSS